MSNCAPVLLVDGVGVDDEPVEGTVPLLFCPQPAIPDRPAADSAAPASAVRARDSLRRTRLTPHVADAVGHAEFAAAVPDDRVAVLVEDRFAGTVDGDVVDDIVGHDRVTGPHHRDRPACSERVDGVPGAVD